MPGAHSGKLGGVVGRSQRGIFTILSTGSKMVTRAGTFLIVAPILGSYWQGHLVLYSAWSAMLTLLVAYGFQVRVLREIPLDTERAKWILKRDMLTMVGLSAPVSIVSTGVLIALIPYDSTLYLCCLLVFVSTILSIFIDYSSCALRALDRYSIEAKISVFSAILQFAAAVSFVLLFRNLLSVCAALFVSRAVVTLVALRYTFGAAEERGMANNAVGYADLRGNLMEGWPYFVDAAISVALTQVDVILLGLFADKSAVGVYGAGSRLTSLFFVIPWMLTNIAVPQILRAPPEKRSVELRYLYMVMGALGGACTMALLVAAPLLAPRFLGPSFAALGYLWSFLAALVVARFLESTFAIRMLIAGKMASRAMFQAVAIVLLVVLGVPAIKLFGAAGLISTLALISLCASAFYIRVLRRVTSVDGEAAEPLHE